MSTDMDGHQTICGRENRPQEAQARHTEPKTDAARQRTISIECMADNTKSTRQTSLLFTRLPLEVRFRIYSLVMPPHRRLWVRPALHDTRSGRLEHFPCSKPPGDTSWIFSPGRCCTGVKNNFFEHVRRHGVQPHKDSLSLMKTCQQVYVRPNMLPYCLVIGLLNHKPRYREMCRLWTFCFDDLATMRESVAMAQPLPVRHLQVMLYAHYKLYCDPAKDDMPTVRGWRRRMNLAWERQLEEVNDLCRAVPGVGTLLVTVLVTPRFASLDNEDAVMASLEAITAVPQVRVEYLSRLADLKKCR